jgi:hypothetical protein
MDESKRGVIIISGVNEALSFRNKNKGCSNEEIIEHIVSYVKTIKSDITKKEILAGVNYALKISEKETKLSDAKIIDRLVNNLDKIVIAKED